MDSALSLLTGGRGGLGSARASGRNSKESSDSAVSKGGKSRSFSTQSAPTIETLSASVGSSSSLVGNKRRGAKAIASQLKTPVCSFHLLSI